MKLKSSVSYCSIKASSINVNSKGMVGKSSLQEAIAIDTFPLTERLESQRYFSQLKKHLANNPIGPFFFKSSV